MNESRLESYRDEILLLKMQGMSTAAMQRELEQRHRIILKKSQFYAFVNQITNGAEAESEGEVGMHAKNQPPHSYIDEEARALHNTLLVKFDEVRQQLANVLKWQSQLDEKEERREQMTRETLHHFQKTMGDTLPHFQQALDEAIRQMATSRVTARPAEASRPPVSPTVTSAFMASRRVMPSFPSPVTWQRALLYTGVMWGAAIMLFEYGYWRPLWAAVMGLAGFVADLTLHT